MASLLAKRIVPAAVGGIFSVFMSLIPMAGYFCCIWVPLGGLVAVAVSGLLCRDEAIDGSDGAATGALSGFFGALIMMLLMVVITLLFGGAYLGLGIIAALLTKNIGPFIGFGTASVLYMLFTGIVILAFTVSYSVFYAAMGAVGGAIGGSLMSGKKEK